MPMPTRKPGESERGFIARFMSDATMRADYPERDQRLAVAIQTARQKKYAGIMAALDDARRELGDAYEAGGILNYDLQDFVKGAPVTSGLLFELAEYDNEVGTWAKSIMQELENAEELQTEAFTAELTVCKVSEEQQLVYAFASVIEENGEPVVDLHGDIISESELVKAAHRSFRRMIGKEMHQGGQVAEIVESIVLTKELQKALGIDIGKVAWLVAMKIYDLDVWQKVKDGTLSALSIGGRGIRSEA